MSKKRRNPRRTRRKQKSGRRAEVLGRSSKTLAKASLIQKSLPIEIPQFGERLLHFLLPRSTDEHAVGDLAEDYRKRYPKLGRRAARIWYYKEVGLLLFKEFPLTRLLSFKWIESIIRNNIF